MAQHTVGYNPERFIEYSSIRNELFCHICQGILKTPLECHNGHDFCQECIFTYLNSHNYCPVDGEPLEKNSLRRPHPLVQTELTELIICCDYAPDCKDTVKLHQLEQHVKNCQFRPAQCPYSECLYSEPTRGVLFFKDLDMHLQECKYAPIECKLGCGEMITSVQIEEHSLNCPKRRRECEFCHQELLQEEMKRHETEECPEAQVLCFCKLEVKRKEIENHMSSNFSLHFSLLHQEHQELRDILQTQENKLKQLVQKYN